MATVNLQGVPLKFKQKYNDFGKWLDKKGIRLQAVHHKIFGEKIDEVMKENNIKKYID